MLARRLRLAPGAPSRGPPDDRRRWSGAGGARGAGARPRRRRRLPRLAGAHASWSDLLRRASVVAVPSTAPEGLSLVALEAMAHGAIVVATACGGLAETMRHGENGFVVPPGDHRRAGRRPRPRPDDGRRAGRRADPRRRPGDRRGARPRHGGRRLTRSLRRVDRLTQPPSILILLGLAALIAAAADEVARQADRRTGWRAAGPFLLVAATPLVPNSPVLLGFSLDDVLPLFGVGLMIPLVPWRRIRDVHAGNRRPARRSRSSGSRS